MELYDTEEQQVEAIKDWWKDNGKSIILGAVLGLGGLLGWRYYQDNIIASQEAASKGYTEVVSALNTQNADVNAQDFIEQNTESEYATLAALELAKSHIETGKFDEALAQFEWVKKHTEDASIKAMASYRSARIHTELKNYDAALAELAKITDISWAGYVNELRGDIALKQNDKDAAYLAYSEAEQASETSATLPMKLSDLAK